MSTRAVAEVIERWLAPNAEAGALLACTPALHPTPGQYLLASETDNPQTVPFALFAVESAPGQLQVAPPTPPHWQVGTRLTLRGPLGKGFHLPVSARKIAVAALTGHPQRLLTVMEAALNGGAEAVLCTPQSLPDLPLAVELLPLEGLREAVQWADFLALEMTLGDLARLRGLLGLPPGRSCPCPAQALLVTDMPCGGLAECGVGAVASPPGGERGG